MLQSSKVNTLFMHYSLSFLLAMMPFVCSLCPLLVDAEGVDRGPPLAVAAVGGGRRGGLAVLRRSLVPRLVVEPIPIKGWMLRTLLLLLRTTCCGMEQSRSCLACTVALLDPALCCHRVSAVAVQNVFMGTAC